MKNYYLALVLALICIIVFIAQSILPGFTESFLLETSDAGSRPWILITSIFLHGSLLHLLGNIFSLGLFGLILEHFIGTKRFLCVFFASGIVAAFVSLFFYSSALGASGAIFGILGTLAALKPKMPVWTYGVPMPMIAAAGFWLLLDILGVFHPSNIANIAHITGLIFGVFVGLAIKRPEPKQTKNEEKTVSDEQFRQWENDWM